MSNYVSALCEANQMLSQLMDLAATILDYCTSNPNPNVVIPIWTAVAMMSEIALELVSDESNGYEGLLKCILHPNYNCKLPT
jgi:hypothetical protein